uniref:C-type lectin domain-containing protein n=1 Tax=Cyprinus carpio TaxID=7962 RepID=A0A8C1VH60_CYPCA
MNLYANAGPLNIHNVRKEKENTRRHQTPQNTGTETHLIITSTHIKHTFELYECLRNIYLQEVIVRRSEASEQLQCITNLTEERDLLLTKITNLTCDGNKMLIVELVVSTDEWINYQTSLYFISSLKKNWTESRRYCTERGADLIIINNREEQDFVKKISAYVWIGLTDSEVEGRWKWVDGSTLTSGFWDPREPNGRRGENCALTYSPGWADYPCSDLFPWICEKGSLK